MKKLFIVALAAFGMVACMNEEITELPNGGEITFDNAFIDNATRAELTADNMSEFKVWGYIDGLGDSNNQSVVLFEGESVTRPSGTWQYGGGARYWAPGEKHYFEAVAPTTTGAVSVNAANGKINTIDYTVDGESDLIYAAYSKEGNTDGSDNGAVAFGFDHLLSRVMFTFNNGFAEADSISLTVKEVKMTVPAKGLYNVEEGKWTVDANTATTLTNIEGAKFVLPYGDSYAYNIEFKVDVTYKGVVINKGVQKKSTVMVALEKGNSYNFTATIDAESLNMESIEFTVGKVEGWTSTDTEMGVAYVSTVNALQAALNNPEIVKVVATNSLTIAEGENVTLNLNGKDIDISVEYDSDNYEASSAIVNYGTLKLTGEGTIKAVNNYTVRNNGTMVIDGVTIENGIMNFGDLTIEDGNISNSRSGKHAIYGNAATLTINGGKFYNGNPGNATIFSYAGEVTINGGEYTIADGTATLGWTSCLIDAQGGAKFSIYGGFIKGEIRDNNNNTNLYGGKYTHKGSADKFVADGYSVVAEGNGVYTVYAGEGVVGVANAEDLQAALNANTETIVLTGDIVGNLNLTQAADAQITILGEGHKFNGYLTMNGKSATIMSAGLTIKDVVFTGEAFSGSDACIRLGNGDSDTRYVCNVTVEGCTFDVPGMVGIKSYTGGDKNLTIRDCVATANAHSLVQAKGVDVVLVENCQVYSKNGMNFNNSTNVVVDSVTAEVRGYAARFGSDKISSAHIKNSYLKSACEESGDAVIELRSVGEVGTTITIEDTVLDGERKIINNATNVEVVMLEDGKVKTEAATQDEFNAAVSGDASITLAADNYSMPGLNGTDVTISGTKDTVIKVDKPNCNGGNVTFNGVTIKGMGDYTGVQHVNTVTYNDVIINGTMFLYGNKVVFNGCTFNLKGNYICTYGVKEVEFINCTFNCDNSKAILIYNEGAGATKATVKGCTFTAAADGKAGAIANQNCAAIEIDNYQGENNGVAHELITEGNNYNGYFSGEWRIKRYQGTNPIMVNGVAYTKTALDGQLMTVTGGVASMD